MTRMDAPLDVPLPRTGREPRQPIGAFARAVGLSASALRQYGESGLLVPAEVETRTGYRYYAPEQQQRAIWIRRLRDAGLGLSRIRDILDGDPEDAERMLDSWLSEAVERHDAAAALVGDLRLSLRRQRERNPRRRTRASVDGAALATAMRQVAVASAVADAGLRGVLLQLDSQGLSVVATDRYLLMARVLATGVRGAPARVSLEVESAAAWLHLRGPVELIVEAPVGRDPDATQRAAFRDERGDVHELCCRADRFPTVAELVPADHGRATRMTFPRAEVRRLRGDGGVTLRAAAGSAVLTTATASVTGSCSGEAVEVELSAAMVTRVAGTAVGSQLTCDVVDPRHPVVWRAPSQPDLVALMMPRAT